MPDELDLAAERTEMDLENSRRMRRPMGPQPTGRCHFCDEIVGDHARWCDTDCRDGWDREQNRGLR